jgi:glycosyltransferase involved in cell wall biosynthesis
LWNREQPAGTLVFGGKLSEATRRQAEALGVICTGTVSAGPFLSSLDALLIPSESESIPRVFYEARVRGVPVLATPAGGIGEEMRDGEDGRVAPRDEWAPLLKEPWDWIAQAGQQPRRGGLDRMLGEYERIVANALRAR